MNTHYFVFNQATQHPFGVYWNKIHYCQIQGVVPTHNFTGVYTSLFTHLHNGTSPIDRTDLGVFLGFSLVMVHKNIITHTSTAWLKAHHPFLHSITFHSSPFLPSLPPSLPPSFPYLSFFPFLSLLLCCHHQLKTHHHNQPHLTKPPFQIVHLLFTA